MKILKRLAAAGMFAMLAIAPFQASAEFGFIVGANTVDDVTTTACTTGRNGSVEMFGGGVDMDQVWDLQREVGSKGSGAWENVPSFTDVFPTAQGGAAVGGTTQIARHTSDAPACYRLRMLTDGGGTAQIQIVTMRNAPTPSSATPLSTHATYFDDFHRGVLGIAALGPEVLELISFAGDGTGSSVVGVGEASPEGILTFTGGDDGDAEDTLEVTGIASTGGLVSAGLIVVEYRSSVEDITAGDWILGLTEDVSANGSEDMEYDVNTNVVTDFSTVANSIAFAFSSDAVNPTLLQAVSTNGAAVGNAADEYTLGNAPVAATYQILRIEIDTNGDAYWYVDGALMGAEPLAVATTATLFPYMAASSADDCTSSCGVTKVDVDYVLLIVPRPAGT